VAEPHPWTPRRPPDVVAEIGRWPIPWRQRWGELCNQFEGVPFPESERRANHQVKAEMAASPHGPANRPAPIEAPAPGVPRRPAGLPLYGLADRGRSVRELITLTPKKWDEARIRLVTGLIPDGWDGWYPVEPDDRVRVLAARPEWMRQRRQEQAERRRRARAEGRGDANDQAQADRG
jgi:hypothetical protein